MTIDALAKDILAYFNTNPETRLGALGVAHNLRLDLTATEKALTHLNKMGDLRYCHLKKIYTLPGAISLETAEEISAAANEINTGRAGSPMKIGDTAVAPAPSATARNQPVRIRRKPYSPFCTEGYKINGDNVTIFLDRRNNARSVTLSAAQLQHILDGVQP